ncbi:MAG: hypothetical protein JNJ73_13910 [Hyphomonadaceae bacterium]|nr:hypothetical protein [Hyphomonadaceae bacterium]
MLSSDPAIQAAHEVFAEAPLSKGRKAQCARPTEKDGLDTSFTLTFVSDYRISGISSSGKAPALQGSVDVEDASGWSAGLWASNIKEFAGSSVEVDLYAARSFDIGATEASLGATLIYLPGGENINVGLLTGGLARAIGPFDASLDVRYAWPQSELGGDDDIYVTIGADSPIGRFAGAALTLGASVGYEEGVFVAEGAKLDWSVSLTAEVAGVELGLAYVDTDVRDENGDAACVFSISRTF